MNTIFKKTLINSTISAILLSSVVISTNTFASTSAFIDDSTINGAFNVWIRDRTRAGTDANGNDTSKAPNLDHGSLFFNLDFKSGYIYDTVGVDLNVYSTFDMWQDASPDHEMNFWGVNNPYDQRPTSSSGCSGTWDSDCNDNGAAFQTAAVKFKFGDIATAKLGYFQPGVPTALGVNWSFAAGTFEGGELGLKFGDLALGFIYADQYRAPWFKDQYEFRDGKNEDAGDVYSIGAVYTINEALTLDVAYAGLTKGPRKNAHVKVKYSNDGYYISPQVYIVDDEDQFDDTAFQLALLTSKTIEQYSFRLESTYTSADSSDTRNNVGNFSYRISEVYGSSNGAYDIWWNNRSDFNHDEELAFFGEVKRDFSDLGAPGFTAGINGAYAFGSSAEGYDDLVEYSGSVFANYTIQAGMFKNASVGAYVTRYVNDSDAPAWAVYSNGFQDESDLKLTLTVPFNLK